MRRRLSVDSKGLKLRQLMPLLERFPDIEVSNANGYFYLNYEEGPRGNSAGGFEYPHTFTDEECRARDFLSSTEGMPEQVRDSWPEAKALAAELDRKRELNHAAGMADCKHEEALSAELLKLIRSTP
jgi:hypothetical protein